MVLTGYWSLIASLAYALLFWLAGNDITALLTDIESVRIAAGALLPLVMGFAVTFVVAQIWRIIASFL